MMSGNDNLDLVCVGVSAVSTALQTSEVFSYISLGITILSSVVCLAYRIWKWYKDAKKDGKITPEEIDTLVEGVKDDITDAEEDIDKKIEKKDNKDGK